MKIIFEIKLNFENVNIAKAVRKAVNPDNVRLPPNIIINDLSSEDSAYVVYEIICNILTSKDILKCRSTVDDLLAHIGLIQRTLKQLDIR